MHKMQCLYLTRWVQISFSNAAAFPDTVDSATWGKAEESWTNLLRTAWNEEALQFKKNKITLTVMELTHICYKVETCIDSRLFAKY